MCAFEQTHTYSISWCLYVWIVSIHPALGTSLSSPQSHEEEEQQTPPVISGLTDLIQVVIRPDQPSTLSPVTHFLLMLNHIPTNLCQMK